MVAKKMRSATQANKAESLDVRVNARGRPENCRDSIA